MQAAPAILAGVPIPFAHAGHWALWILYAIPILIVAFAIVRSTLAQRRARSEEEEPG
jgi:flagellar biosynthesis/type III secretory pathway M-ring protein FliF/YscJ